MTVRILAPAEEEFLEAVSFYEAEAEGLGAEFIDEFEKALELISSNPHIGSPYDGGTRRKLLGRYPFQLIYEDGPAEIVVVALAHQRRRPGYWRNR
jgi:plasmid stabilization system protein ParE